MMCRLSPEICFFCGLPIALLSQRFRPQSMPLYPRQVGEGLMPNWLGIRVPSRRSRMGCTSAIAGPEDAPHQLFLIHDDDASGNALLAQ